MSTVSCCVCCLQENMSAFCVETQDRTMVFAALKDDCVDWVEKLCHSTFQVREKKQKLTSAVFIVSTLVTVKAEQAISRQ